jgi:hypothetical protein
VYRLIENGADAANTQPEYKKKIIGGWAWKIITGAAVIAGLFWTVIQIRQSPTFQELIKRGQSQNKIDNQAVSGQIPAKNLTDPNQKKP